jgi:predicted SAM-dependent methyltransferase
MSALYQMSVVDKQVDLDALVAQMRAKNEREAAADKLVKHELARLSKMDTRRLHLGCGAHAMEGWANIDGGDGVNFNPPEDPRVLKLDVFVALAALPDRSADFIHSEQFFEHFSRQDGLRLMKECHRVLKPGGVMRTQVPDLERTVRLYLDEVPFAPWKDVQYPHRIKHISNTLDPIARLSDGEEYLPSMMINNGFYMDGHKYLYDWETLEQSLRIAGFGKVVRCDFGVSEHDALNGIDHHDGGETGRSWVPKIALTAESTRTS